MAESAAFEETFNRWERFFRGAHAPRVLFGASPNGRKFDGGIVVLLLPRRPLAQFGEAPSSPRDLCAPPEGNLRLPRIVAQRPLATFLSQFLPAR